MTRAFQVMNLNWGFKPDHICVDNDVLPSC